jgi:hypothetical protein
MHMRRAHHHPRMPINCLAAVLSAGAFNPLARA